MAGKSDDRADGRVSLKYCKRWSQRPIDVQASSPRGVKSLKDVKCGEKPLDIRLSKSKIPWHKPFESLKRVECGGLDNMGKLQGCPLWNILGVKGSSL